MCCLCLDNRKASQNLFFHCGWVYFLWSMVANLWNMCYVGPEDIILASTVGFMRKYKALKKKIGRMTFLALI